MKSRRLSQLYAIVIVILSIFFFFLEKFLGAEYRKETEMFFGSRRALLLRSKRDVHAESTSGVKRVIREDGGFALNSRPECRRV